MFISDCLSEGLTPHELDVTLEGTFWMEISLEAI